MYRRALQVSGLSFIMFLFYHDMKQTEYYTKLSDLHLFEHIIETYLKETQDLLRHSRNKKFVDLEKQLEFDQRYQNLQNCIDILNNLIVTQCQDQNLLIQWDNVCIVCLLYKVYILLFLSFSFFFFLLLFSAVFCCFAFSVVSTNT